MCLTRVVYLFLKKHTFPFDADMLARLGGRESSETSDRTSVDCFLRIIAALEGPIGSFKAQNSSGLGSGSWAWKKEKCYFCVTHVSDTNCWCTSESDILFKRRTPSRFRTRPVFSPMYMAGTLSYPYAWFG